MSQNNTIRKSDKKFIAREKGRIRAQFSDVKKQQELIDGLYKKFLPVDKTAQVVEAKPVAAPKVEPKKEVKKAEVKKDPSVAKAMEGKGKKVTAKSK